MSEKQIREELNQYKIAANIMANKGRVTKLEANTNCDIISIETKDKDVIKWVKKNRPDLVQSEN